MVSRASLRSTLCHKVDPALRHKVNGSGEELYGIKLQADRADDTVHGPRPPVAPPGWGTRGGNPARPVKELDVFNGWRRNGRNPTVFAGPRTAAGERLAGPRPGRPAGRRGRGGRPRHRRPRSRP